MKSVFNTDKEIHKIWDLKGSTLGRRAKRGDGVSKDLDFVDEGRKLSVGPRTKVAMMAQLKKDADFLARMHIMDYSLLVGVHLCTKAEEESEMNKIRRSELLRSNTPMRRQLQQDIMENGGKAGVLKNFFESARDVLGLIPDEERTQQSEEDSDSDRDDKSVLPSPSVLKTVLSSISESGSAARKTKNPFTDRDDFGIVSVSGDSKEIYFAGVIDILQLYNTRKWGETIMRKAIGGNEKAISCVHPEVYAERFVEFIENLVE